MIEWIKDNWDSIVSVVLVLYAIAEVVVKLTPSEKDNSILKKVVNVVNQIIDLIIPNLKKGGGTHNKNAIVK
jgi:hypothetical protein